MSREKTRDSSFKIASTFAFTLIFYFMISSGVCRQFPILKMDNANSKEMISELKWRKRMHSLFKALRLKSK